jgi:hypothetical protein
MYSELKIARQFFSVIHPYRNSDGPARLKKIERKNLIHVKNQEISPLKHRFTPTSIP